MKVKWLIQDVSMNYARLDDISSALDRLGFEYTSFGVIPFSQELTNLENILDPDYCYVLVAGTKVLTLLDDVKCLSEVCPYLSDEQVAMSDEYIRRLKGGIFYDVEMFDQKHYAQMGLPLLNADSDYYPVRDFKDLSFDEPKFIKPSRDLKAFDGGILEAGVTIEEFIKSKMYQSFYIEEDVVISSLKKIFAEYRFFVVDGQIVGKSQYKLGDKVIPSNVVPEYVLEVAEQYKSLYRPHDVFTMDIADTSNGCKIVEYNCWNASGHYHADLLSTYHYIQEYILSRA